MMIFIYHKNLLLSMQIPIREYLDRLSDSRIFLFIISVVIGIVLFKVLIGVPRVGVITLDTPFLVESTKDDIIKMIRFAEDEPSIKAVNIVMDSPGGEVSKIEEIYLEVLKLRAKKPVVVSVDSSALSGGYYVSSAADFIYVKPSSEIGSIGVISSLPDAWRPDSEQITTGPFKASGKSRKSYAFQVEAIKHAFLEAVTSQRGDKLHIDPERLSTAEIFLGLEGVKYGLADAIGTDSDAVRKAASIAGISNYDTLDINQAMNISFTGKFHGLSELNKTTTPANYYIYQELEEQ